jgi:outer membrane immunogenic protein
MRKFLLAGSALAALSTAAAAADITPVAVMTPASFSWSGFYAGVHVGYGTGRAGFDAANAVANHRYSGGIFGVQFGANHQFANNVVLGLEATIAAASLNGSAVVDIAPAPFGIQRQGTNLDFLTTVGPRLGYALDRSLIYAKAGFAAASFRGWFQDDTGRNTGRNWRGGWFVGVGVGQGHLALARQAHRRDGARRRPRRSQRSDRAGREDRDSSPATTRARWN